MHNHLVPATATARAWHSLRRLSTALKETPLDELQIIRGQQSHRVHKQLFSFYTRHVGTRGWTKTVHPLKKVGRSYVQVVHTCGVTERLVKEHGKIRLLVEMHDFHGWTAGALWADIKFDAKHFKDIERIAMVGETKWQHGMAVFCKPFTAAKIRYFERAEIDQARTWLTSA